MCNRPPAPLARTVAEALKGTETTPDKGDVYAHSKTQQWRDLSARPMFDAPHAEIAKHVASGGRALTSTPKIASPVPNHRKHLDFMDNQKMQHLGLFFSFLAQTKMSWRSLLTLQSSR